ncbi:MAG: alkaline phosphatase D family protein, partial [Chitinophagales bacterium]|nr:alkaline phosphatase D family protein [Chitinophagales bacterium]
MIKLTLIGQSLYYAEIYSLLKPELKPFYFGVASGDPTENSVNIWSKILPDSAGVYKVSWEVAEDSFFSKIARTGFTLVDSSTAYTLIEKVHGLEPGKTYYYRFSINGIFSPVGRTKTAAMQCDTLRLAVVSCNDYQSGYYNAFGNIASRKDIDAVIHLGDYIYEYPRKKKGQKNTAREHIPAHEIISLKDYRSRYAQYRLDSNMMEMHRLHPVIAVWDDHEFANDAWTDSAENHQSGEGLWHERKRIARKVYFEWLPVFPTNEEGVIRELRFGNLATLFMLDTRIANRSAQLHSHKDSAYLSPERHLIGRNQSEWLINGIKNNSARWSLIGNQVLFSPLDLSHITKKYARIMDVWDGYPAERKKLIEAFNTYGLK